jgi:hypothetical protein
MEKRLPDVKKIAELKEQKKAATLLDRRSRKPRGEFTGKDKGVNRE